MEDLKYNFISINELCHSRFDVLFDYDSCKISKDHQNWHEGLKKKNIHVVDSKRIEKSSLKCHVSNKGGMVVTWKAWACMHINNW